MRESITNRVREPEKPRLLEKRFPFLPPPSQELEKIAKSGREPRPVTSR